MKFVKLDPNVMGALLKNAMVSFETESLHCELAPAAVVQAKEAKNKTRVNFIS